jgi:hypothetical protein
MTAYRDLTPEPVGVHAHWLFSSNVQDVIERKSILFYIKNTHSADGAVRAYEGCVARTLPFDRRSTIPRDGEITVSVIKKSRQKQLSINPKYLVPLGPIVGGEVTVVSGILIGVVGVVKAKQGQLWVVSFPMDSNSVDQTLEDQDLTPLEDFM